MKIEKYFVLNKYLLSLFGVKDFKELQQKLKDSHEGTDTEGRTYFVNTLISAFSNVKISERELLRYDLNIQEYLRKISYKRSNISLKYFQYLAVLFSEIVLDNLKNKKTEFIYNLNEFLKNYEDGNVRNFIGEFTVDDLRKLAFYMATGSGKTLIAHINYYQFFKYDLFSPDNIIFITPNEGLSKQHFEELEKSGIPAKIYSGSLDNAFKIGNEVLIIEITKFVEEKKGGGVTIPVDVFEGKNLIFVDEGHKGKKSDEQKWAKLRDKLSEKGFVFEYSATFGQVLSEKNEEILKEYSKSIVFDYSYKYFYLDGYGKDFFVANAEKVNNSNFQEIMFVANLLSFYEQLLIYEENKDLAKEYNIEKPLWIFVGTTVAVNKNKKEEKFVSDVVQIVKFIEKAIKDEKWLKKLSENIINGNTGLVNQENKDIFGEKFKYLRSKKRIDFDELYEKVFNGKGDLYIYELKNAEGEFGLKVAENPYFGVINIGDTNNFKKQFASVKLNLEVDAVGNSLFDTIKDEHSTINILIGAKKFIEGWDTWRVSSMGLLNIGKTQGPLIIQLFGRGVRLKGKNMSLKRSEENFDIKYLEILNIYSINADYLKEFLEAIRKEEIELETIEIPVKLKHTDKWNKLSIPYKDNSKKFEEEPIKLEYDDKIHFTIDLMPIISIYEAKERKEEKDEVTGIKFEHPNLQTEPIVFPNDKIELLDWNRIYQELCEWKNIKRYWNLIIDKEFIKSLLHSNNFKLLVPQEIFNINSKKDIKNLEDIALTIIKRYLEKFYEKRAKEFETSNLTYEVFDSKKCDFPIISEKKPKYIVQIKKEERELIKKIRNLLKVENIEKLYQEETKDLPRVYIDEHLFLPILLKSEKIEKIIPEGIEKSEESFIKGIKRYLKLNKAKLKDYEIYILRNFSKSGVGFQLQWSKFYPDFIMWIKNHKEQIIVFIEPHGLEHSKGLDDEKIQFATSNDPKAITIKKIEENLNKKDKKNHIRLEYFLLSPTEYEKLKKGTVNIPKKEDYENKNVLFLEDNNWPEKLFTKLGLLVNINSKR